MYPSVLASRRRLTHRQHILADPAEIFPLLCPMRETEWLPGWSCSMIHSVSGVAEPGAVFETDASRTVWLVTEHRAPARVGFVRFQSDGLLVEIGIDIEPAGDGASQVDIDYCFTALDARGDSALDEWDETRWASMMRHWETSMNRWFADRRAG